MKRPYPYTGQGAQAPAAQQPPQAAPAAAYSNYGYGGAMGSAAPGYGQPIAPAPPAAQPQAAASTSHEAQQRQWHQQWQEYYAKQAAQAGTQAAPQQQTQPRPAAPAQPYQSYGAAFPQNAAPHQAAHQQQQAPTFGVQSPFPQPQGPAAGPMPHGFQPQAQQQPHPQAQQPYSAPLAPAWNASQPTQQQPPPRPFYNQQSQSQFPQAAPPAKRPRFEPPSSYGSPQAQGFHQTQHPLPAPPHAATQGRPPPQQPMYGSDPSTQNAGPAAQNSFGWNSPNAQRGSAMPPQQQSFRGGRGGARGGMAGGPVAPHAPVTPIQNPNAGNPLLAGVNSTPPAIRAGRGAFGASRGGAHGGRGGSHAADLGDRSGRAGRSGRTGFGATPKFASAPSAPSGPGSGSRSGGTHGRAGRSGASASSQSAAFEQAHRGQPVVSAMSARLALGLDDAAVLSTKNKKQYFADFNFASIEISGLGWKWSAEKSDGEGTTDPAADGNNSPDIKIAGEGVATETTKPVASPSPPGRLRITFASAPSNTGPPGAPSGPSADVKKGTGPDVNGKVASTEEEVAEASDWSPFSKGQHQPSNNRIALLYGPPTLQRRLAIDAEIVKEVRVFREEARWEMEVRIQTQPRVQPPDKDGKRTREWVVARGVSIETREGDDNFIAVTRPQLERAWTTKSNITSLTTVDKGADKKEKRPNGLPGKPSAAVTGQSSSTNDDADAEVQADVAEKTEGGSEGAADGAEADADAKKAELSELQDDREPPIPGLYLDLPPLHHLLEHSDSEAGGQRTLIISVSLASLQSEEPAWLQTGLVDDWLSKLPGYRRAPEMQPWIGKVRIMDPNPSPSIEDVLTDWATSSTVGFGRDRRNFVKDHFGTSRALAEVFAKLCLWRFEKGGGDAKGGNGAAAVSTTGAGPTLQSFKELGVPLSLPALSQPSPFAAPDSSAAGKMSHLGFAALSLFGLASQYATQAGVEDETLREQIALLLMMVPETALHRAVDLIYRDYLASHPAPKKSGDASSSLSGASAVGAAYASGARRGSVESLVAGGDLEVAATAEAAIPAPVKDEEANEDASASRQVKIDIGDGGSPAREKVEANETGADGAEAIDAERTVKDEKANLEDEAVAPEESPPFGARGLPSSQTVPSPGGDLEEDDETMQEGAAQHAINVEEPEDSDHLDPGMDVDETEHRDQDAASVKTPEESSDLFELEEDAEGEEE